MKTSRSSLGLVLGFVVLVGLAPTARAFCVMQCFWDLSARYDQLVQDLTALVNRNVDAIASDLGRWGGVARLDRQARAQVEIAGLVGGTEKAARDAGRSIGANTVKAEVEVLGDARVIQSTRSSLEEVKNGTLAMTLRGDLDDATVGKCATGLKNSANSHDAYTRAQYTAVEAHSDLTYLHQQNPQMPAGDMFSPAKLAGAGANEGAAAEIGIAARLDLRGEKIVHLGPDSDPASPFFGQSGHPTGVDTLTQSHMYNIGVTTDTLQGKFQPRDDLATKIKNALDARTSAGLPSTMRYKFAYVEEGAWHPVIPGTSPPELAQYVKDVNSALSGLGVAANDLLKPEDFVLISLAP